MAPKSRKRNAQDAPSASHVSDETAEPTYDAIRFRSLAHQQHFFEWVQNRTPNVEVPFQLHSTEFLHITAEIERRGWHYLCNPIQGRLGITLLREFYANAKKTKRERALNPPVYISCIRGKDLDYSPESLKVILQLPDVDVEGPTYEARRNLNDLRLGEVLRDIATESKDPNKRLPFTSVIYRLLFANGFKKKVQGDELIPIEKPITAEKIKASQEITHKVVLELRENQNKHINDLAAHRKEYRKDHKEMKAAMEKSKAQFETANQYWHRINNKNEQKIDYLCWGIQQVNPYLKGRLPEDIPEWMQANLQAGRGRFSDGMSRTPRDCWPGATSRGEASASKEDKGKGKAEEGDNDERGKKKCMGSKRQGS
ncbi:hypothetical protein PIB30_027784 [Stylosanthes scabra]|uniref:Uncharacterized protein n=1 Tax=Stylosanthes scabra TaxID=79078 RepID=A0ABU6RAZ2_9FABA|nr:hypothetical protein [Stylosanthes scabra]